MAGVEENDIDRLLVNPPEKVEIEVKYKIDGKRSIGGTLVDLPIFLDN